MYESEFFQNELDIAFFSSYRYAKLTFEEYFKSAQNNDLILTYYALTLSYFKIARYSYNYQKKHIISYNHEIDEFLSALDVFLKMMATNIHNNEHYYWPGLAFENLKMKYKNVNSTFELHRMIN